jgi:hypothetical protein
MRFWLKMSKHTCGASNFIISDSYAAPSGHIHTYGMHMDWSTLGNMNSQMHTVIQRCAERFYSLEASENIGERTAYNTQHISLFTPHPMHI